MTNRPGVDDLAQWCFSPRDFLILDLLRGATSEAPRSLRIRRLTRKEEREGCKALAGLLRSRTPERLHDAVCCRLADQIDPDVKGARTLVFKNRKGALAQERHNAEIVHFMWKLHELDGLTVEKAAEVVHKDWKVGERWARNLWYERPDLRPTHPL